jgi:hypothetical protein
MVRQPPERIGKVHTARLRIDKSLVSYRARMFIAIIFNVCNVVFGSTRITNTVMTHSFKSVFQIVSVHASILSGIMVSSNSVFPSDPRQNQHKCGLSSTDLATNYLCGSRFRSSRLVVCCRRRLHVNNGGIDHGLLHESVVGC